MNRIWLWLVLPGLFLMILGGASLLEGGDDWWYLLLGISNFALGLSMRIQQAQR